MSGPGPEIADRQVGATSASAALTVPYRVRFDEATPDGVVRTSALLRYAQDCAWVHSERLGFGRDWYAERGLFWVARAVELRIRARAGTGSTLRVTTTVLGFRRVWARRRTDLVAADGAPVADVDTDWVLIDERGAPARVPDDFTRLLGASPVRFEPHRVVLPPTPPDAARTRFATRPQELDPMAHANNAAYLDWLEEAALRLPDGADQVRASPRTYRLEFLLPAVPGAALEGAAWREPPGANRIGYRLVDQDGELLRGTLET